jgi:AcrR family transcriptional regulator
VSAGAGAGGPEGRTEGRGGGAGGPVRTRDADRSREAILAAAETLFADRGFARTSMADVGAAAGLSRQAPAYFFGSKERLHVAVLERVFAARQDATAEAFAPVHAWCADGGDLIAALTRATEGYLAFLLARPAFTRLLLREDLDRTGRLEGTSDGSTAMRDAFTAIRDTGRDFDVDDALVLYVGLTYTPVAHAGTFMASLGRDLTDAATRARHVAFVVDQLEKLLSRRSSTRSR